MSIEGIVVSLVILLLTAAAVVLPLRRGQGRAAVENALLQKQRERLLVYYERVLTNIRDLDEDYATGKIAPEDHAQEREVWVQRGVQVLRALDDLHSHSIIQGAVKDTAAADEAIDAAIEASIKAYRQRLAGEQH
jgi:hypothetical protein